MIKKEPFGEITADQFSVGDIVKWGTWNTEKNEWDYAYGIITNISNEIRADRLISISSVIPVGQPQKEMEFFTVSLKLVSKTDNIREINEQS